MWHRAPRTAHSAQRTPQRTLTRMYVEEWTVTDIWPKRLVGAKHVHGESQCLWTIVKAGLGRRCWYMSPMGSPRPAQSSPHLAPHPAPSTQHNA